MSFFSNIFGNSKKPRRIRNSRSSRPIAERKARLDFLALEERVVPAVTVSLTGSVLSLSYAAPSDSATVTTDASGNIVISGTPAPIGTPLTFTNSQITQIAVTNDGTGPDALTFAGAGTLSLSAGLTNTGTGKLVVSPTTSFTGPIVSNSGTLELAKPGVVSIQDTPNGGLSAPIWNIGSVAAPQAITPSVTTPAFTVSTGANLLVYEVFFRNDNGDTLSPSASAVSWGSTPMTYLTSITANGGPGRQSAIYYLKNPTPGTNTFVVTTKNAAGTAVTVGNVYSTAFSANGFDTNSTPSAISVTTNAGTIQTTSLTGLLAGSLAALTEANNDTWSGGNGVNFTASTGALRSPYLALMTQTDGVNNDMSFEAVTGLAAGTTTFTASPVPPQVASKQAFSVGVFAPGPGGVITLSNNVVYNASSTLDFGSTISKSDNTLGSLNLPSSSTTLTLADGRTVSFSGGITSNGANSIVPGASPPSVAVSSSTPVNVTGSLSIGSVIADNPNNGGAAAVTGINQTGSGTLTLTGNNTYTGGNTLAGGILSVGSIGNVGAASNLGAGSTAASNLVFAGGTLQFTGASSSSNRGFTINPGATATFDVTGSNRLSLSGSVPASTGSLTKIDTGSLILGGNELYTGLTSVNGGTLNVTGSVGGAVSVAAGAFLGTGVNTTFGGGLTSTGATINLGGTGTAGTLTLGGDLTADAATTLNFDFLGSSLFDAINAQNVSLGAAPKIKIAGSNFIAGTYDIINFTGTYTGGTPSTINTNANFIFTFQKTSNALQMTITPKTQAADAEWSLGGNTPIVDGAGSWGVGSTDFVDVTNQGEGQITFQNINQDNGAPYDVIFGGGGAGGAINVTDPVSVSSLTLGAATTPYQFSGSSISIENGINAGNTATIANSIVLDAPQTWAVNSIQPLSVTGAISESVIGAGSTLTVTGNGTLFLGNNETYTGGTSIGTSASAGSVVLGVNNALPTSGAVTLANNPGAKLNLNGFNQTLTELQGGGSAGGAVTFGGGTLAIGDSTDFAFGGTFAAGAGTLTKQGSDNLTLTGASPFAGTVNVNGGTLTAAVANTFGAGATINIGNGDTLNVTAANAFSGDTINILSGGTLTVTPALLNALNGATIVIGTGATLTDTFANEFNGANLVVKTGGVFAVGTLASTINGLSLQGGSVTGTGTLTSSTPYDAQAGSVSAVLAGAVGVNVGINKTTTGTVTLAGVNAYSGTTSITGGTLAYGINNAIPTTSAITINGAGAALALNGFTGAVGTTTLQGTGSITGPGTLNVSYPNTFELQSGTVTAVLGGTGGMNKTIATGTVFLGASATYTGPTNIQAGTLASGTSAGAGILNAIPPASVVTMGTTTTFGIFDINNGNQTFTNIVAAATTGLTSQIINSFASTTLPTLTINNAAADTYAGFLGTGTVGAASNGFNLLKLGIGVFTISGANTFTGTVTVNLPAASGGTSLTGGVLQLGNAKALGSTGTATTAATVIVNPFGEIDLNGQVVDPNEVLQISGTGTQNATSGTAIGALINNNGTTASLTHLIYDNTQLTSVGGNNTIMLAANTTASVTGYLHSLNPSPAGAPGTTGVFTLARTATNGGTFIVNVTDDPDVGNITIAGGRFTFTTAVSLGVASDTATIQSGGSLSLSGSAALVALKNIVLMSGATLSSDGTGPNTLGDGTANYTVNLVGNTTVAATISANTAFTLASLVSGPGNLTKNGGQILTPTNTANNFPGTVNITSGAINVQGLYALGGATATAPLNAQGGGIQIGSGLNLNILRPLTISGTGFNNGGAIESLAGTTSVTFPSAIVMSGAATIGSDTGSVMTLPNDVNMGVFTLTYTGAGNVIAAGSDSSTAAAPPYFVGFTGATGGSAATQKILNWTFNGGSTINQSAGFATNGLTLNGGANLSGTALQLTDGANNESRSAFQAVTAGAFTSSFQFQMTNPVADGFAYVFQANAATTVGGGGGGLGYSGIANSVGIQFNEFSNVSQFGVGVNGVNSFPTDLTAKGINFHTLDASNNTDIFQVTANYDGAGTLTVTITDTKTAATTGPMVFPGINPFALPSIVKAGAGSVTLAGTNNSYSGLTNVNAGTLVATNVNSLGTGGPITIAAGATLDAQANVSEKVNLAGTLTSSIGSPTFSGALALTANTATVGGASNQTFSGAISSAVNGVFGFSKIGSDTVQLTNNTSTYTGVTSVNAGILDITSVNALGATTAGTVVATGATLQVDGGINISGEPINISGAGAGGIGALNSVNGNNTVGTVTMAGSATIGSGTSGNTLTIGGITMANVSDLTFTGAGNADVLTQVGNGASSNVNGFSEQWFPNVFADANLGDNAATGTLVPPFNNTLSPNTAPGYLTLTPTNITNLTSAFSFANTAVLVARAESTTGTGAAATTTAMNNAGSKFGAAWLGTLTVGGANMPAGPVSFGTNSDDGSVVFVDLNQDGIFESNELIVNSDGGHGTQQRVGTTPALAAGNYAVYIGYYESSGGGSMEARVAAGTQATYTSQLIIDPSSPAQAGVWGTVVVANNNNVIMNGTGTVEMDGNDTYNGTTTINSGTLEVDGVHTLAGAVNVNVGGTLAGKGTLPGAVTVGAGATLSPGTLAGSATGILSVGSLTFAAGSPTPALNISVNGALPGTEYDQVKVATGGSATLNGAALNLTIGTIADATPTQVYTFLDMTDPATAITGNFAGHAFGTSIIAGGKSFGLSNTVDFEGGSSIGGNDGGLVTQVSNNYFVSATWAGDAPNTDVTDLILTDGQTATFGVNAFATIQDALAAVTTAATSITAVIVNPGAYGDTTVPAGTTSNPAPTIVLQGTAISIDSLTDITTPNASITLPAGTTLTVGVDNLSSTYDGTILGGGSFVKSGSGNLTLNQNNIMSGTVEVAGGTLQLGDGSTVGTVGAGTITVDPTATLNFDEPGNAGTTTLSNKIAGSGTIVVTGSSNGGAVTLIGSGSTFSGGLTINGGRIALGSATSIGNPATVVVNNGGQFSFGTATNATFSGALSLTGNGYSDPNIAGGNFTGALLFTGTTNAWSGPITVNNATFGALLATGTISGPIGGNTPTFGDNNGSTETFVLTNNNNNWTGQTTIQNNATVNIGNNNTSGVLPTSTSVFMSGSAAFLDYDRTDATTWGQLINGSGGIRVRRGGTLSIDGTTNPSATLGSLIVGSGTLNLSGGEQLVVNGPTSVGDNLNSGVVATTGTVTGVLNVPSLTALLSNTLDVATTGSLATVGTVNQTGGTVTLAALNSPVNDAGLRLGVSANGTGTYNLSSGSLSIGNKALLAEALAGNGNFVQTGGTVSAFELDVNAIALNSAAYLSNSNPGANFSSIGGTTTTGTGTYTLGAGLLQLGNGGVTFDGGTETMILAGGTLQFTDVSTISTPLVTSTAGPAILDTQGFTVLDTQPITGAGTLSKLGTGTLNMVGASTYTGGTTVAAGKIGVYNNAALGTGTVTLNGGSLVTGALAGLAQGSLIGATNTTSVNPANAPLTEGGGVVLGFASGVTAAENSTTLNGVLANTGPDPVQQGVYWGSNNTWVYTGWFFDADPAGKVAMAEQIDDDVVLVVDGATVLNDTRWDVPTTTSTTAVLALGLGPNGDGWHKIELRVANGGGGAGPSGAADNNSAGWTATYGFGFQGIGGAPAVNTTLGDINGADYAPVADPGNGSVFRVGYSTKIANNIVLAGTGTVSATTGTTVTLSGTISGTGALNDTGSGNLVLTGNNSYSGGTSISGGTLSANSASALGTFASVNVASGTTLSLGASETISALAGSGTVLLNGNFLTVGGTDNLSSTFDGVVADGTTVNGELIKAGTGSLTLTGVNTFAGTTVVSAGSLIVNGSLNTLSTVAIGATGILGGSGTVGTVTNLAGVVNPGSTGNPATLNVNNLTLGPGALVLDLSNVASDSVNVASAVDITGATLSLNVGTISPGESFTILTVPGTSGGLTGSFVGLDGTPGRDTITAGGTSFTISYTGGDGNDIILTAAGSGGTSIVSTVLNSNTGFVLGNPVPGYVNSTLAQQQHSMVESVVYSFSQAVSLSAANFTLTGINGTTTAPNVNVSGSGTQWTVTFSGTGVNSATDSIGDGEYSLVLNGVAGLPSSTYDFFRLMGDMDGNGTVNSADFLTLIGTFLRATSDPAYLGADDLDGDGTIGSSDLLNFTGNFLVSLPNTNLLH